MHCIGVKKRNILIVVSIFLSPFDRKRGLVFMIVKEEFLSKLRRYFSLNLYEVKIWTALLSRGVSTAGELSDIANVPRSRSYDVLESLEKKGFVVMKLGKPIKYLAVPPKEVLERVKKNVPFTIEPGIYLPGKVGLRIEDTLVWDGKKVEILTKVTKDLIAVDF